MRGAERWNECEKERGRGDSVCVPMCMQICVCEHVSVWLLGLLRACACMYVHMCVCVTAQSSDENKDHDSFAPRKNWTETIAARLE